MSSCAVQARSVGARRRAEQLRRAKRAQRARERARGLRPVQLSLPARLGRRLLVAAGDPGFEDRLERFLEGEVIRVADFPALRDIAWNRRDEHLTAREAFGLYERNWRHVDAARLGAREAALIRDLADRFGNGIVHG